MYIKVLIFLSILILVVALYSPIETFNSIGKNDEYSFNGTNHTFPLEGKGYPVLKDSVATSMIKLLEKTTILLEKNDIPYWATCGTLLGIERHKGLIPWDDDLDINVPLEYIDKTKKVLKTQNLSISKANGGYKITHKNSYPFVDIIVVNKVKDKWMLCYPLKDNKECSYETAKNWPQECFLDTDVFPLKKIPFENITVNVPNNYLNLIKQLYGEKALSEASVKSFIYMNNHKFGNLLYNLNITKG